MLRFLASVLTIYVALCIFVYVAQRFFMYFPTQDLPLPNNFEVVKLHTKDGLALTAWYKKAAEGKPTLIYFHGNGGNIDMRRYHAAPYIKRGIGVLLVEYRGYGDNPGKPTEVGLYQDADAAYEFIQKQGIAPSCILLYGESLGSGVAVDLAARQPVAGLILQAPFSCLADVAQTHYPIFPTRWLVKDRYDSIAKIGDVHVPIFIAHGTADKIVPYRFGRKLYDIASAPKQFSAQKGYRHNNLDPQIIADEALVFLHKTQTLTENNVCKTNPN